ncbi:ANTAR domain-containing protein [Streptomyces sp. NPDC016845]|uniref:ANTAR domain-containing protein n=1 Tax=Streptomyces sp. NPDC016845 TaxID=3364972 RepID=UPI0037A26643
MHTDPSPRPDAHENGSADERARLEAQAARLRQVVRGRAVLDQAVGVLLTLGRMTPAGAWNVLRQVSERTAVPLRETAGHLVGYARSGVLPDVLREEVERHLPGPWQRDLPDTDTRIVRRRSAP